MIFQITGFQERLGSPGKSHGLADDLVFAVGHLARFFCFDCPWPDPSHGDNCPQRRRPVWGFLHRHRECTNIAAKAVAGRPQ